MQSQGQMLSMDPEQGLTTISQVVAGQHMHVGRVLAKDVACRHNAHLSECKTLRDRMQQTYWMHLLECCQMIA